MFRNTWPFSTTSRSSTENVTLVDKPVLSPQLFRKLEPDQAIALLSVNGHRVKLHICPKSVLDYLFLNQIIRENRD